MKRVLFLIIFTFLLYGCVVKKIEMEYIGTITNIINFADNLIYDQVLVEIDYKEKIIIIYKRLSPRIGDYCFLYKDNSGNIAYIHMPRDTETDKIISERRKE